MEDLRQFAISQGAPEADELTHSDTTFWSKRLRESKYEINEVLSACLQVETLFHEFCHALQHMLTKQDEGLVAGIHGIEWDAVELPFSIHGELVLPQGLRPNLHLL